MLLILDAASNKSSKDIRYKDEDIMRLATLPKLEELELCRLVGVTGKIFKNFTTLKKVTCECIQNMQKALVNLILKCPELKKISLYRYSIEDVISVILSAAMLMRKRENDVPLEFFSDELKVRLIRYISDKDSSMKVFFEVRDYVRSTEAGKHLFEFTTYEEKSFIDRVALLVENSK